MLSHLLVLFLDPLSLDYVDPAPRKGEQSVLLEYVLKNFKQKIVWRQRGCCS